MSFIEDRFLDGAEKVANATGQPLIFDVAQVLNDLYGYKPANIPGLPTASTDANSFSIEPATQKRTTLKGSALYGLKDTLGREVFCPIVITARGVDYEFPYAIIGMRSKAIIVETPMVERRGAVIEEIGIDAWRFVVKGFFVDPLNQFPDQELDLLNQLWETREPVRLKCALTDLFLGENDRVVMTQLDIPEKAKVIGVRDFSFELVQDGILDLYNVE